MAEDKISAARASQEEFQNMYVQDGVRQPDLHCGVGGAGDGLSWGRLCTCVRSILSLCGLDSRGSGAEGVSSADENVAVGT